MTNFNTSFMTKLAPSTNFFTHFIDIGAKYELKFVLEWATFPSTYFRTYSEKLGKIARGYLPEIQRRVKTLRKDI